MDKSHERRIDELVDSALAGWASEPRSGLENRTVARLRAARLRAARRQRSRPAWSWFAAGIATAAVFAFVLAIAIRPHVAAPSPVASVTTSASAPIAATQNPARQAGSTEPKPEQAQAQINVAHAVHPAQVQRATRHRVADVIASQAVIAVAPAPRGYTFVPTPRTSIFGTGRFPSPAPLSEQELLLAKLAAQANPLVLRTLAEVSQQHEIQPIEIKPIEITPLEPGPQQSNRQGEPQ